MALFRVAATTGPPLLERVCLLGDGISSLRGRCSPISLRSAADPYRGRLETSGPLQGSAQKKQIRFSIVHHAMISEALQSIPLGNRYLHKRIYFLQLSSWWQRRATAPAYFRSLGSRSDEIQTLEDILTLGTISRVSPFSISF